MKHVIRTIVEIRHGIPKHAQDARDVLDGMPLLTAAQSLTGVYLIGIALGAQRKALLLQAAVHSLQLRFPVQLLGQFFVQDCQIGLVERVYRIPLR